MSWYSFIPSYRFTFCGLSYVCSTSDWKYYMGNSRNRQFISFKLSTILSRVMKFGAILLCPAWDMNQPCVLHIQAEYAVACWSLCSCLSFQILCHGHSAYIRWPSLYLEMAPKLKNSGAAIQICQREARNYFAYIMRWVFDLMKKCALSSLRL
jgi:hypothetical protein